MEFLTTNGNKSVKINPASFQDAINLKKAAMQAFQNAGVLKDINLSSLSDVNINITNLIDKGLEVLLTADISETFEKAVFACLENCIYDEKLKITPQLFDDKPELREDYYEIVSKCCEVNLRPFFKSLVSEFSNRLNQLGKGNHELK